MTSVPFDVSRHLDDEGRSSLLTPRLSRVFFLAWILPFIANIIGVVDYQYISRLQLLIVLMPVVLGWLAMRSVSSKAFEGINPAGFSFEYLRKNFYLFALVAAVGNYLLRLSYAMSGVDTSGGVIQEMYMAVLELQNEGSLSTGPLGSVAQLMRTAQPFALIFGVFLAYRERRVVHKLLIASILVASTVFAYMASFSRGSIMFYLACTLFSAWCLPIPRKKLLVFGGALIFVGALFFLVSARDRALAIGVNEELQVEALQALFTCDLTTVSRILVDLGGPQLLGLALYLVSPIAEGAYLYVGQTSPMMMGGFFFFPYVNPVKRLVGVNTEFNLSALDHINMWCSAVGEMWLDFSWGVLVIFPLVAYLMYLAAISLRNAGLWGRVHFVITGVFFLLFPLYSVFHSYGLVYALSLCLALRAEWVRRDRLRHSTSHIFNA